MRSWSQLSFLLLVVLCSAFFISFSLPGSTTSSSTNSLRQSGNTSPLPIPMDPFPEAPWRTPDTLKATTIASTPFARFELHRVRTETGVIVDDWMWTDERSHVNVLVHLKKENKYLLFYQKKYGLEKPAYATLGGLFKKGETAMECATRELEEETGLVAEDMVPLGKYRVQVNRGGGFLYAFLARNSFPKQQTNLDQNQSFNKQENIEKNPSEEADADYEKQEHRLLTQGELLNIILSGEVGEAQWVATAAVGLLMDEHRKNII